MVKYFYCHQTLLITGVFAILQMLWIVSVFCFLAVAVYQTSALIIDYLGYPTITRVDEHRVDLTAAGAIYLPDLLVCNLNPLSHRMYTNDSIPSVEEYTELVENLLSENNKSMDDATVDMIKNYFLNVRGYYAHIGPEQARVIGHTKEEFIVSCKVLQLVAMQTIEVDCEEEGKIQLLQYPKYFNCFVISMGPQTSKAVKVGYSVTLHLDNVDTTWHQHFPAPESFEYGAMIMLRAPKTYPNFIEGGHYVAPVTQVNLKFRLEHLNRLKEPYGTWEVKVHCFVCILL